LIRPSSVRIEASSICQLECPICPTFTGKNEAVIGRGTLKFEDFKGFIDANAQIRSVELGNFGEVFLNKGLPKILRYAYENGVRTTIDEGANMNNASDEVLEALVKYQTVRVRCAVDGVTQETYQVYRAGGNLKQVINNIQKINTFKQAYKSEKPELIFQFIIFGHNEDQIESAKLMARLLNMKFEAKLNWSPEFMSVQNREKARQEIGYADRTEYLEQEAVHYKRQQCYEMWHSPQINWDGKLLGCSRNFWGYYEKNIFETGFLASINNEKIQQVREILMGSEPTSADFPCLNCGVFHSMLEKNNWITKQELAEAGERNFWHI
jgi:hypothetical protein